MKFLKLANAAVGLIALGLATACTDADSASNISLSPPPADEDGWLIWARPEPVLIWAQGGGYRIEVQCAPSTLKIAVADMVPVQAFPQPQLTIELNGLTWTAVPVAESNGGGALLKTQIYVFRQQVSHQALAEAVRRNTQARLLFNGAVRDLDPIPEAVGKQFADHCEKAWWD